MQHTVFSPGCYSAGNINLVANGGTWPLYNNDRSLTNVHAHNMFLTPATIDQYLGYDKEKLRQTMMKHDATFRNQVHELHRLYKRQWELMLETKRRELAKHQLQSVHSNHFLSQNLATYPLKTWQLPSLPCGNSPALTSANLQEPSSVISRSTNPHLIPTQTESRLIKSELLDPDGKKSKKRLFDLELPADEYIDSEEEGESGEEKVPEVPDVPYQPKMTEVSPTSDFKMFPFNGLFNSVSQEVPFLSNPFPRRVNDLANMNEPVRLQDVTIPVYSNVLSLDTLHRKINCFDQDLSVKSSSEVQISSKQNVQIIPGMEVVTPSKIMHLLTGRHEELESYNHEAEQRRNVNHLRQVSSSGVSLSSKPSQVEHPARLSMANQLDKYDQIFLSERTHSVVEASENNHDLANSNYHGQTSSCKPASFQLVPVSDVVKSEPSSFLSQRKSVCYSEDNALAGQPLPCFKAPVPSSNSSKSSEETPGVKRSKFQLRKNSNCITDVPSMSLNGNSFHLPPQLDSRTRGDKDVNAVTVVDLNIMPPSSLQDPSEEMDMDKNEKFKATGSNLAPHAAMNSDKQCSTSDTDLDIGIHNKFLNFGQYIDLNSCAIEDESSVPHSLSSFAETMAERDLTAPVSPENQECSPPRGESEENQVEVPLKPSKLDHLDPQEELVRIAAEAIVLIGSSGFQSLILDNAASEPLKACRSDVLQWFADVVSSLSGSPGDEVDCGDKNIFSDGSDYFETMTLNLPETKEEEYCFTSIGQREEETGSNVAPDLPRRARTRRARQRKDFQTEVLPSLASLSRHEVTEDLQTFGGLMEAVGMPLETASGRRNSSRYACTRGRKLQRSIGTELATGERRLAVWGKKNKRRRIQRFPG